MLQEIERKFLVNERLNLAGMTPQYISQGYIGNSPLGTIRVRVKGERGYLTIKGHTQGISRAEYEYEIPYAEACELLDRFSLTPVIEKFRYLIPVGMHTWEVDVFEGANNGLIVAEIELGSEDEEFERPDWIDREVSVDPRYRNSSLAISPYTDWAKDKEV